MPTQAQAVQLAKDIISFTANLRTFAVIVF